MQPKKLNQCPICNRKSVYHLENIYRPFCSDRCKLIDLGEWASEIRRIASNEFETAQDQEDM